MNSRLKMVRVWILVIMIYQIFIGIIDIVPEFSKYNSTIKGVVIFQGVLSCLILAVVA